MSLVRAVHTSVVRQRLIESMTTLCKDMGMKVVAEGVEVPEEHACVRQYGCDLLQGFLFARPGPGFAKVDLK
jgi:EAL domain-containing protein (putative c-di-GMP-specific phosphodiesterase class I)